MGLHFPIQVELLAFLCAEIQTQICRWYQGADHADRLRTTLAALTHVDMTFAKVRMSRRFAMQPPQLNAEGVIRLTEARHPLLLDLQRRGGLDAVVLPSFHEGFPNVVLEAFGSARPVVAVRLPATVEIIENGVDGVLVDDSASKIAEAVVALLADGDLAASMGRSGRRKVEGEYSIKRMADAYQRLYESVTQGTKVSG